MDISLVKLVLLLAGLLTYGRPDGWNVAVQARLLWGGVPWQWAIGAGVRW